MLKVDIHWRQTQETQEHCVLVSNIGGGSIANYRVHVMVGGEAIDRGVLQGYPRWSEPLQGLVARALVAVTSGLEEGEVGQVDEFVCTTSLVPAGIRPPRVLAHLRGRRHAERYLVTSRAEEGMLVRRSFHAADRNVVRLLTTALCRVVWKTNRPPPLPLPLSVTAHVHERISYVREDEIPRWAIAAFCRFSRGFPRPAVPDETGRCSYAWVWARFLGQEARTGPPRSPNGTAIDR